MSFYYSSIQHIIFKLSRMLIRHRSKEDTISAFKVLRAELEAPIGKEMSGAHWAGASPSTGRTSGVALRPNCGGGC